MKTEPRMLHNPSSLSASMSNWNLNYRQQLWNPPTDVYETYEGIFVRVEVAGMSRGDFEINLDKKSLSIRGMRSDIAPRKTVHRMEIRYGEFEVNIEIGIPIQAEQITAHYQDGFLCIKIPKAEPKKIHINTE